MISQKNTKRCYSNKNRCHHARIPRAPDIQRQYFTILSVLTLNRFTTYFYD